MEDENIDFGKKGWNRFEIRKVTWSLKITIDCHIYPAVLEEPSWWIIRQNNIQIIYRWSFTRTLVLSWIVLLKDNLLPVQIILAARSTLLEKERLRFHCATKKRTVLKPCQTCSTFALAHRSAFAFGNWITCQITNNTGYSDATIVVRCHSELKINNCAGYINHPGSFGQTYFLNKILSVCKYLKERVICAILMIVQMQFIDWLKSIAEQHFLESDKRFMILSESDGLLLTLSLYICTGNPWR